MPVRGDKQAVSSWEAQLNDGPEACAAPIYMAGLCKGLDGGDGDGSLRVVELCRQNDSAATSV
jgi:hypothetical protein